MCDGVRGTIKLYELISQHESGFNVKVEHLKHNQQTVLSRGVLPDMYYPFHVHHDMWWGEGWGEGTRGSFKDQLIWLALCL